MPITLVNSRTLPTETELEGSEFVSMTALLQAYGVNDEYAAATVYSMFRHSFEWVEKRNDKKLLADLERRVIGKSAADEVPTPLVTKDGWVYWIRSGHHENCLEGLTALYTNTGDNEFDFLIREGIFWQIRSMQPDTIYHGPAYKPTKADRAIFSLFKVDEVIAY